MLRMHGGEHVEVVTLLFGQHKTMYDESAVEAKRLQEQHGYSKYDSSFE
jgi:hypothetical protein